MAMTRGLVVAGLLSGLAAAQSVAPRDSTVLRVPPTGYGCPVGIAVRRVDAARLSRAADTPGRGEGQRLRIAFTRIGTPRLVRVEGVAHGYVGGALALPVESAGDALETERFWLGRDAGEDGLQHAAVQLKRLTGVS